MATNPIGEVSERILHYALHDTRDLRNKYLRVTGSPWGVAGKLPRDFMVKALVRHELGDAVVDEYLNYANIWREMEQKAVQQWVDSLESEQDK